MTNQLLKITACGKLPSKPKTFAWGRACPQCGKPAYHQYALCAYCGREVFEPESILYTYEIPGGEQLVLVGDPGTQTPLKLEAQHRTQTEAEYWVCQNRVFRVVGSHLVPEEELLLRIQHAALKGEKELDRIRYEFQNPEHPQSAHREPIPRDVQREVWRRDEGKCAQCKSNEKLEFDHIVPFSRGGSNTARNIQLLCETCNRQKGAMI